MAERRVVSAVRSALPEGTLAVGVGLLVNGVAAYGFLAVSARALGAERYAPLGVLWTVVFLLGPGCFLPVEQEVSRALAERAANGQGGGPLVRRAAQLALVLLGILLVAGLATNRLLLDHLFDGQALLLLGLALAMVGAAAGHLTRGTCSGQGRFRPYAIFLGGESSARLVMCVALAVIGVDTVGWYGVAIGVAPLIGVGLALARERGLLVDGPPAGWREVSGKLLALLVGSILSFTLVNGGPVAVELLGSAADDAESGRFLNGLIVARVPLFLFQAVQAALLPRLSGLVGLGQFDEFRAGLRRLLLVTIALGSVATISAFAIGPEVVTTMFGAEFELSHRTLGLLAMSCAAYMLAVALAQAVIALGGHRLVAASWALGVAAFVAGTAVSANDLFLRVELGLVAGSAVAAVALGIALVSRLRGGATLDKAGLLDALHELSLEP